MPANHSHHPSAVVALVFGLAMIASLLAMLVELSTGEATVTVGPVPASTAPAVDIACFRPSDSASVKGCKFKPNKRYDYVDGVGAWIVVPDDHVFANGNRPPLGSELMASTGKPVPAKIRAQFAADGVELSPECVITYGDTSEIRCPNGATYSS